MASWTGRSAGRPGGSTGWGWAPGARLMIRMDDDLSYILTFFDALAGNWCRCPLLHAGAFNWTYTLGVGLIES